MGLIVVMKVIQFLFFITCIKLCGCQSNHDRFEDIKGKIYSNVTIIDGLGNDPFVASIVVKDSIIIKISHDDYSPSGFEVIDCTGKYVIPGLIDTHIHATVLEYNKDKGHQETVDMEASLTSLKRMTEYGVMFARSVAGPLLESLELKRIAEANQDEHPFVFVSGPALNKSNNPPFVKITGEEDVKNEIKFQHETGADLIKVYASIEADLVELAINESHRRGLKVVGHLQRTNWTQASKMGIDFITHASPWSSEYLSEKDQSKYQPTMKGRLDWIEYVDYNSEEIQEMLTTMKSNNVMFDPTLIAFHTKFWALDSFYVYNIERKRIPATIEDMWSSNSYVSDWTEADFQRAKKLWPKLAELTYRIYKAGIPITVGTDFPNPWIYPGLSVHMEMQLLNESGIPILEVIKMATYNGAVALGIEDRVGSITEGKLANLIFLNSNPITNIESSLDIVWILKSGKRLD